MAQRTARIVRDEDVMSGDPRIEGTRITVRHVHALVDDRGHSANEVAERHDLDIADVYRALTYYHDHRDEMERLEAERDDAIRQSLDEGAKTLAAVRSEQTE